MAAEKGLVFIMDMESGLADALVRRIIDMDQYVIFRKWDMDIDPRTELEVYSQELRAIIISGSSKSLNSKKHTPPRVPMEIFQAGVPILGICYGMQLLGDLAGSDIVRCWGEQDLAKRNKASARKDQGEQGPVILNVNAQGQQSILFRGLAAHFPVWMKHNWMVRTLPEGWVRTASTNKCPLAAMERGNIFAIQFHPEPYNSLFGKIILHNFLTFACKVTTPYF